MTILTEAFATAATLRARSLGMPDHPTVVVEHPLASRTKAEVLDMAERFADRIVRALVVTQ